MAKKLKIHEVLNSLSKEELISVVAEAAELDSLFKNSLLMKYGKEDSSLHFQSCKNLIASMVKNYTGREGFIPYRQTNGFAMEMLGLLNQHGSTQDVLLNLDIALLVLEEGVEAFQYADDSNCDIGMMIDGALERIIELKDNLDPGQEVVRKAFFGRLLSMSLSSVFKGWEDFRIALLRICTDFADVEANREQLVKAIEGLIIDNANTEYWEHTQELLLGILFTLIQNYGSQEETEAFVYKNLHFTFFRGWAIEKCMENEDYRRAITLAEQGEQQDKTLPGLVSRWKEARYEAYKRLSLKQEQKQLARELLLDGEYSYYHELEKLFEGDPELLYRGILKELKEAEKWRAGSVYLQLISDKNDLAEMMAYVKDNPDKIEEFAPRLSAEYKKEIEELYANYIYATAASSTNRKQYQRVGAILKRYKKIAGESSLSEIILTLENQYNKRTAFLDELGKLK